MTMQSFDVESFIRLRKQTRAVSDALRQQASDYISTLSLLINPQRIFGEFLQGAPRGSNRESQHAFKEFKTLYEQTALSAPFGLVNELEVPLDLMSTSPVLYPYEYDCPVEGLRVPVRILNPVRWVVGFEGFELAKFRRLMRDRNRSNAELHRFLVHYLMLFYCVNRTAGLGRLLLGLRFPISFERVREFGELPLCVLGSPLTSRLPSDDMIRNSTEIAGNNAFEELIDESAIASVEDELKLKLQRVVASLDATMS